MGDTNANVKPNVTSDFSVSKTGSMASAVESSLPGGYGAGYRAGDGFRLSARTCLTLLSKLSDDELDHELDFLNAYYPDMAHRTRGPFPPVRLHYNSAGFLYKCVYL